MRGTPATVLVAKPTVTLAEGCLANVSLYAAAFKTDDDTLTVFWQSLAHGNPACHHFFSGTPQNFGSSNFLNILISNGLSIFSQHSLANFSSSRHHQYGSIGFSLIE